MSEYLKVDTFLTGMFNETEWALVLKIDFIPSDDLTALIKYIEANKLFCYIGKMGIHIQ